MKIGIKDTDMHCSSQTTMQIQEKNLIKPHAQEKISAGFLTVTDILN